ncbi:uncharacterized protein LOC117243818 isoform X3 [Parus major]|uniref:uncharacterized protein LOC117243818 isoform X3 n=1 Tax=Parus major TaxID=9157 RepID=UPI0014440AA7|nr:uncharacterized protein LOC117243818 isoform X3 [Parus major]
MKFKESFNAFFPLWGDQIVLSSTRFWDGKGNSCRMTEAENYETENLQTERFSPKKMIFLLFFSSLRRHRGTGLPLQGLRQAVFHPILLAKVLQTCGAAQERLHPLSFFTPRRARERSTGAEVAAEAQPGPALAPRHLPGLRAPRTG